MNERERHILIAVIAVGVWCVLGYAHPEPALLPRSAQTVWSIQKGLIKIVDANRPEYDFTEVEPHYKQRGKSGEYNPEPVSLPMAAWLLTITITMFGIWIVCTWLAIIWAVRYCRDEIYKAFCSYTEIYHREPEKK